jgi:hypothetical protein
VTMSTGRLCIYVRIEYACDALIYLLHLHASTHDTHECHLSQILEPSGFVNFSMYAIQHGCPQLLNVINRTVIRWGRRLFRPGHGPIVLPNEIRIDWSSVSNVLDIDASNDHIISVRKALRMCWRRTEMGETGKLVRTI